MALHLILISQFIAPTLEGGLGRPRDSQPAPPPTPPDYCERSRNRNLCLPPTYSKFELPFVDEVNVVEIGIDISDVLRIDDKVSIRKMGEILEYYSYGCSGPFWVRLKLPNLA